MFTNTHVWLDRPCAALAHLIILLCFSIVHEHGYDAASQHISIDIIMALAIKIDITCP